MTGDAVAATIAHEVQQPLSGMITNAGAGLRWLDRPMPDLDEAKAAFKQIVADGHRAGGLIGSIRAMLNPKNTLPHPAATGGCGSVAVWVRGPIEKSFPVGPWAERQKTRCHILAATGGVAVWQGRQAQGRQEIKGSTPRKAIQSDPCDQWFLARTLIARIQADISRRRAMASAV
jgi:hypothetical protein